MNIYSDYRPPNPPFPPNIRRHKTAFCVILHMGGKDGKDGRIYFRSYYKMIWTGRRRLRGNFRCISYLLIVINCFLREGCMPGPEAINGYRCGERDL